MAEDQGSIDLNSDENSHFEGFNSDDIGDRESIVPDSEPGTSDIEVSSVRSSDLSDLGEEEDENAEIDGGGGIGMSIQFGLLIFLILTFTLFLKKVVLHCLITLMLLLQVHWLTLTCYSNMKFLKISKSTQTAMHYLREMKSDKSKTTLTILMLCGKKPQYQS